MDVLRKPMGPSRLLVIVFALCFGLAAICGEPCSPKQLEITALLAGVQSSRLGRLGGLVQRLHSTAGHGNSQLTRPGISSVMTDYANQQRPSQALQDLAMLKKLMSGSTASVGSSLGLLARPALLTAPHVVQQLTSPAWDTAAESSSSQAQQSGLADVLHVPAHALQRRLQQLSGLFRNTKQSGGQLTTSTTRSVNLRSEDGTTQVVSNDFSSYSGPVTADALGSFVDDTNVSDAGDSSGSSRSSSRRSAGTGSTSTAVTASDRPTPRIVGGVEAPTDRKYICSLRIDTTNTKDFHFCGCSLISPSVVLTAAHCLASADLNTPWVEIGRYYQQAPNDTKANNYDRFKCTAGVVNPDWSADPGYNDVALCFLDGESRFTPVKLAANIKLTVGEELTVMGWGSTSEGGTQSDMLMQVSVATTDLASCNSTYGGKIVDSQICAGVPDGGKDACQGDSGGPLIIKGSSAEEDLQVGIVSYGVGCARPSIPGVYTDVRAFRKWIAENMLARKVSYAPITDGYSAKETAVDQAKACACSTDGRSGNADLGANLAGCKQHSLNMGDSSYYCYAQGGRQCTSATPSVTYSGAAWLDCEPPVVQMDSSASPSSSAASSSSLIPSMVGSQTASVLGNIMSSWLAGAVDKAAPHILLPPANATVSAAGAPVAPRISMSRLFRTILPEEGRLLPQRQKGSSASSGR